MLRFSLNYFLRIRPDFENLITADFQTSGAPIVFHSNAFYVVGGLINEYTASSIIGRLDALTLTWTKAGELIHAREGHGAIYNGEKLIVAGGERYFKSESCDVVNGLVTCTEQEPTLYYYWAYPEMFLVPATFCKNI